MAAVDVESWKEFRVGDLSECNTTLSVVSKTDLIDGSINYVTRSAVDNGLSGTCGNEDQINQGDCITIGAEGFVAFWQKDNFVAGNKVYSIRHECMNELSGLFVCAALNTLSSQYSFSDARVLDRIKDEVIKLPATDDGQPDWAYMEAYMGSVMERQAAVVDALSRMATEKRPVDVGPWVEFRVGDLFDATRGKVGVLRNLDEGDTPVIAAAGYDQGVAGYYGVESAYANALTASCNGVGCGSVFYHPGGFNITGDALVLLEKFDMTEPIGLFLESILHSCLTQKYSYAEKLSPDKVKDELIKLPATPDGEPDWAFMGSYMAQVMERQERVVEHLGKICGNR